MENHFVVCACSSSEHTLRFVYDRSEDEMYTEVQLVQHQSLIQRLKIAIKYVFGYTSRYGAWDCTLLSKSEANKLKHFLNRYTNDRNK